MAKKGGTLKTSHPMASSNPELLDNATPYWLETQAEVTRCQYVFARMNTLTLGGIQLR